LGVSNTLPIFGGCVSYFTHGRVEPEFRQILDPAAFALFLKHMDKLPPAAEQAWQNVVNGG
jgi:hypothetical protein